MRKLLLFAVLLTSAAFITPVAAAHHSSRANNCTPGVSPVQRSGDAFAGAGSDPCSGTVRVVVRAYVQQDKRWVDQAAAKGPGNNTIIVASGFCLYAGRSSDQRNWQTWASWNGGPGNYLTNSVNDSLLCVPQHG